MWDSSFGLHASGRHNQIISNESLAKTDVCFTADGLMNVYPGRHFHIGIKDMDRVDEYFPKPCKGCEVVKAPQEIIQVKEQFLSYSSVVEVPKTDSFVKFVHYRPATDRLEQRVEVHAFLEDNKNILEKNWREKHWVTCVVQG